MEAPRREIQPVPQLLADGFAGVFSKACTGPIACLTILFQVQGMHNLSKPSISREALRIVNEEGIRAFWKGNLVTTVHCFPYAAVNFYAYDRYESFFKSFNTGDIIARFVSGGLAGITAATAAYPLDLVRTRLATQRNTIYYRGIGHALTTICRDEGFWGLYKGLGATLLRVGPSLAIIFCVYGSLFSRWRLQRPEDSIVLAGFACGGLSGIASSTATFPLDLVRRRMQVEGAAGRERVYKKGLSGTFRQVIRCEGFRGLYRGIVLEYCKVVPAAGILFMTREFLKKLMSD